MLYGWRAYATCSVCYGVSDVFWCLWSNLSTGQQSVFSELMCTPVARRGQSADTTAALCGRQAAFYQLLYGRCDDPQAVLHSILRQKEILGRAVCAQVLSDCSVAPASGG